MTKKILISLAGALALAGSIARADGALKGAPAPFDGKKQIHIALIRQMVEGEFMQMWQAGAERQAALLGVKLTVFGKNMDNEAEANFVYQAINMKVDGIILDHGLSETLTKPAADAVAAVRIVQDNHEVGSHGYRHENYGDMTAEWVKEDIQKAHGLIKEVTGVEPTLLRPPNGHYSNQSLKVTDELGYKTIIWNVDSLDWKNPGRDVIIDRVTSRIKPGSIILLHASDTPTQTAEALPILLDRIQAAGYKIVTVGELLTQYSEKGIAKH